MLISMLSHKEGDCTSLKAKLSFLLRMPHLFSVCLAMS